MTVKIVAIKKTHQVEDMFLLSNLRISPIYHIQLKYM